MTNVLRFLVQYFDSHAEAALTTGDVVMLAYGVTFDDVTKSHRVATLRAMRNAGTKRPALRTMDGEGPEGQTVLYNSHNVRSYGLARLKADWLECYQRPSGWWKDPDEAALLAMLDDERHRELVTEGGAWFRHVQQFIAEDTGDRSTWLRYEIRQQQEYLRNLAALGRLAGVRPDGLQEYVDHIARLERELASLEGVSVSSDVSATSEETVDNLTTRPHETSRETHDAEPRSYGVRRDGTRPRATVTP